MGWVLHRLLGAAWPRMRGASAAGAAALLAANIPLGAAEPADVERLLAREWLSVEVAVVRHRVPDEQGEALVLFEPRRYPRGLMLLAGSVEHPPVLEAPVAAEPAQAPLDGPLPPAWMWADPPSAAPEEDALGPGDIATAPETPPAVPPLVAARAAIAAFEQSLVRERANWRREELSLARAVARLGRSSDFEVAAHGRWLQALPPSARPRPLFAQFGARLPGGVFELEGTITVSQGRYIDIALELIAPVPAAGGAPWQLERDGYALLAESRRARDGEIHYFDHPRFGVVVRAQELAMPEELVALLQAAEEGL